MHVTSPDRQDELWVVIAEGERETSDRLYRTFANGTEEGLRVVRVRKPVSELWKGQNWLEE